MQNNFVVTLILFLTTISVIAQDKRYEVKVDGLSCPICTYGLEKKLKSIDGIINLKIELSTGVATFAVKDGKIVSEDQVRKNVKDAGYTFKEMKLITSPKKE